MIGEEQKPGALIRPPSAVRLFDGGRIRLKPRIRLLRSASQTAGCTLWGCSVGAEWPRIGLTPRHAYEVWAGLSTFNDTK